MTEQITIALTFDITDTELAADFMSSPMLLPNDTTFRKQYETTFGMTLSRVSVTDGVIATSSKYAPAALAPIPAPAAAPAPDPHPLVKHPAAEPTEAQLRFLRSLHKARHPEIDLDKHIAEAKAEGKFTRGDVSEWIDRLKSEPKAVAAPPVTAPTPAPTPVPTPKEGFYTKHEADGRKRYFRAKKNRYGGMRYSELKETVTGWSWTPVGLWAKRTISESVPTSFKEAASWGKVTGVCMICGHRLTDPTSIARGIGPVCNSRIS